MLLHSNEVTKMSYSKRLLKRIKEQQSKSNQEISIEDKQVYDRLIQDLKKQSYPDAVDTIEKIVSDPKLQFILSLGFGGPLADISLESKLISVPIISLTPMQKEIDLDKSLAHTLNGKSDLSKFFHDPVTVVSPLVTFNGAFIIDGHHRWSQAYCTYPYMDITCIDFRGRLSPIQILKATQATIGSNLGKLPSSDLEGINLYDKNVTERELNNYITKKITKKASEDLQDLLKLDSTTAVVNQMIDYCMMLKTDNPPILNAPSRDIMPQTRKDVHCLSDLEKGITKL